MIKIFLSPMQHMEQFLLMTFCDVKLFILWNSEVWRMDGRRTYRTTEIDDGVTRSVDWVFSCLEQKSLPKLASQKFKPLKSYHDRINSIVKCSIWIMWYSALDNVGKQLYFKTDQRRISYFHIWVWLTYS